MAEILEEVKHMENQQKEIRSEVMKYYNNLLKIWIREQLEPCIISLKDIVLINYKFKNFA